ncbi:hypothetical protein [Halomonas garicola]|uniref:hypothetical protein n=1 Tax=Halomonas garicola TaxID=1690008 RepID=UPI002897A62B|nr:hypothetical protein [Halomonas garicola]
MIKLKPSARPGRAPRAPAGDAAFAPLYDPSLRWPVRRAWLELFVREGVQAALGMPLERLLMGAWLGHVPGHAAVEQLGLPRRALGEAMGEALTLNVRPRELIQSVRWGPIPRRKRPSSVTFIWNGEWDQHRGDLRQSSRYKLISELDTQRDALTQTRRFRELASRLAEGRPWQSHQQGVLLNSRARILTYLQAYLGFLDDMAEHGFNAARGKDALGVAVSRDGRLLKINRGLHRLAMAQYLGLDTVPVQVRAIHRQWWARVVGNAHGAEALERLRMALGQCVPESAPGLEGETLLAQDFRWPAPRG